MEMLLVLVAAHLLITPIVAIVIAVRAGRDSDKSSSERVLEEELAEISLQLRLLRQVNKSLGARISALEEASGAITPPLQWQPDDKQAAKPSTRSAYTATHASEEASPAKDLPAEETVSPPIHTFATPAPEQAAATPPPATPRPQTERIAPEASPQDTLARYFKFLGGKPDELTLMQWFLPRIGGVLALLALLFFGIHVNRDLQPLPRLLEMAALSVGTVILGLHLERKLRRYGGVLVMLGVMMCYLTSFAAYAFPPVRVLHSAQAGVLAQGAVLTAIVIFGMARRSRNVVMAAFIMAWPMLAFMVYGKVGEWVLGTSAMLCIAGCALPALHRRFATIPSLALPFGGIGMILMAAYPDIGSEHDQGTAFAYLGIISLLIPLLSALPRWEVAHKTKLAAIGSALAGAAAYFYFSAFHPSLLGEAFLLVAAGCTIGCAIHLAQDRSWTLPATMYAAKASAFATLWLMCEYSGHVRWAALLVQAVSMGVLARRSVRVSLLIVAAATAVISIGLFLLQLGSIPLPCMSPLWLLITAFPLLLLAGTAWAMGIDVPNFDQEGLRDILACIVGTFIPLLAIQLQWHRPLFEDDPALSMLALALVPALLSLLPGFVRNVFYAAASSYLLIAGLMFCIQPESFSTLALLLAACAGAVAILRIRAEALPAKLLMHLAFALAVFCSSAWVAKNFALAELLPLAIGIQGLIYLAISRIRGLDGLRLVSLAAPLFILSSAFDYNLLSLVIPLLWLLALCHVQGGSKLVDGVSCAIAVAWMLGLAVDSQRYVYETQNALPMLVFIGTALYLLYLGRRRASATHVIAGLLMNALCLVLLMRMMQYSKAAIELRALPALASGISLPLMYLHLRRLPSKLSAFETAIVDWALPLLTWAALCLPLLDTRLIPTSWYTPLLALVGFSLVIFGILTRSRSFRLVGLTSLTLPCWRLFWIDLTKPIQRIAAFGAGGTLVMLLGYLYHRLSTLIGKDSKGQQ